MTRQFHRPVCRPGEFIDQLTGTGDPAELNTIATNTAWSLLNLYRKTQDPVSLDKSIYFTDQHGIDELIELWGSAPALSLAGALLRLYQLRASIVAQPEIAASIYSTGYPKEKATNSAVKELSQVRSATEMIELINSILRVGFSEEFSIALDQAATLCQTMARGISTSDPTPKLKTTKQYAELGAYFTVCARQWRNHQLS